MADQGRGPGGSPLHPYLRPGVPKKIFFLFPSSPPPLISRSGQGTVHAMLNSHYLSDWDGGSIAEQVRGLYL